MNSTGLLNAGWHFIVYTVVCVREGYKITQYTVVKLKLYNLQTAQNLIFAFKRFIPQVLK